MRHNGGAGRLFRLLREDEARRALAGAAVSLGATALFALYHGYLGLCYGSAWHGSICVFYLLLSAIRGGILLAERSCRTRSSAEQRLCRRRTLLRSAVLLLTMDLALIAPISMLAALDRPVSLGLIPAIAMAAYTTWKLTMASIQVARQRRRPGGNPLLAALRSVNFIDALVAVLSLQNTLIMVNWAAADENAMRTLSAVSSAAIYAVILGVTVRMLRNGLRETRRRL